LKQNKMRAWTCGRLPLYYISFTAQTYRDKFKYVKANRIYFSPHNLLSIKEENNTKEKKVKKRTRPSSA
jgi:hypothetical protein